MAVNIILRLGESTANDVSLVSSGISTIEFPLTSPTVDQTTLASLGDGNSLGVPSWSNVTETLRLYIADTTPAGVAAKIEAIERLANLARQGTLGQFAERLYIVVQFDHDTTAWRSQILAARLDTVDGTNQIWRRYTNAGLIITRRYFWESVTLMPVEVSSGPTPTPTTGYATVYNADDTSATNRNWFQIASTQIVGSIPAPAKISIKNTSGATRDSSVVYLGNYVFSDPTTIDPIMRGEDAYASDTSPGTTEGEIYSWDMTASALASHMKGQFGRFVVIWSNRPAIDTMVRAAVMYKGPTPSVDLALGEFMLCNPNHFTMDLGALPIPPTMFVSGMGPRLYAAVKAKAAAGTDSVGIDWLQIFPSGAGRYRVLNSLYTMSLFANNEIIDDGPNDTAYVLANGTELLPLLRPFYEPIYLWPFMTQRIRMVISGAFSMEPGIAWGVKVEYRPRRLSF